MKVDYALGRGKAESRSLHRKKLGLTQAQQVNRHVALFG
jgi:hypothetical protein